MRRAVRGTLLPEYEALGCRLALRAPLCASGSSTLLQGLAMLRNIQALELVLLRDPQRHEDADELEDRVSDTRAPHQCDHNPIELDQQLLGMTLDQARHPANGGGREHAGEQRAGHAADGMHAEHVERMVVFETVLEPGAGPIAHCAGDDADHDAGPWRHEA